jgi:putative endonuclease
MHINTYIYHVYILTNHYNSVLYTGFTGKGVFRIEEHKIKSTPGFTTMYKVDKLVYIEQFDDVHNAIAREKQIKRWSRKKKDELIVSINPKWIDLYEDFKKGIIPKRSINNSNNSHIGGPALRILRGEGGQERL